MLSKYEASDRSAMDIEDVVGELMEELGIGGHMLSASFTYSFL